MASFALHHVALIVTDLQRATAFYERLFGFRKLERPPFRTRGVWFDCGGGQQFHLIVHSGSFRSAPVDTSDWHFALKTDDFERFVAKLTEYGFNEDGAEDDPMRMVVQRSSTAGFPQVFFCDPDGNIVEVNGAP